MDSESEINKQCNEIEMREELKKLWARIEELGVRLDVLESEKKAACSQGHEISPSNAIAPEAASELKSELQAVLTREAAAQAQICALEEKLRLAASREQELKQEILAIKKELQQSQADKTSLQRENADLKSREQAGRDEIAKTNSEISRLIKRELPSQSQLLELQKILDRTPASLVELARSRGYNFASLPAFLTSCGKIENLRQLWEACASQALAGQLAPEAGSFLESLLMIFNAAFPENKARLVSAICGDKYHYEEQDRGASNGDRIAEVLLPGMRTPGGTLVKCVVRLN